VRFTAQRGGGGDRIAQVDLAIDEMRRDDG